MHITCLVTKDHKKVDLPLDPVDFDAVQLYNNFHGFVSIEVWRNFVLIAA